ncbi:putative immunity/bacteriocin fusion bifunctional protein [Rummeliibacillus suwonensis]|uniref:putative immunity/bacteriocin fusion bifunctional protein n=1 Tax=Rummeliibacillus suwonensis TaxID=1306154 RepID=UPI0011B70902|nr:putative immunity/bacteriocin fusion bifunctional protein [Rummeliibacillus suwonensis]
MKKLFFTFLITVFAISTLGSNFVQAKTTEDDCNQCEIRSNELIKEIEKDGTDVIFDVNQEDQTILENSFIKTQDYFKSSINAIEKKGFEFKQEANSYLILKNYTHDDGKTYEKVGILNAFYIKKNNKSFYKFFVVVDLKNNEPLQYQVVKYTNNLKNAKIVYDTSSEDLEKYNKNDKITEWQPENNPSKITLMKAKKFKFSGISFACSVSGIIACAAAFGGLAAVVPGVGIAAGLACELAFAAGCSVS